MRNQKSVTIIHCSCLKVKLSADETARITSTVHVVSTDCSLAQSHDLCCKHAGLASTSSVDDGDWAVYDMICAAEWWISDTSRIYRTRQSL